MQPAPDPQPAAPPVHDLPGGWSPRRLAWLGGAFIAVMAAQAGHDIWRSQAETVRSTERELASQARVIAEQTARSIQAVDVVLTHLAQELKRGTLSLADTDALHRHLHAEAQGLVQTDGLVVFGPDGQARAVSQVPSSMMAPLSIAAQAPFGRLRDERGAGLTIENVRTSPGTQRRVFPIGRRFEDGSGRFAGVVGAPGRVEYFQNFYRDSYPDSATRIALAHRQGWLLARYPSAEGMLGRRLDVLDRLLPPGGPATSAVARLPSPVDGADHFVALQVVPDYPLVVAVSRDAGAALAPWRAQALTTTLRTLGLGALAAGLLWLALRQLARADAARRSLLVSEQRYALAMTGSDEGHWLWDIPAQQVYVSARLSELFGMAGGAQVLSAGEYFSRLPLHPDDRERVHHNREEHVAGRTPRLDHEFRVVTADGGERWIHTRAQCFRDAAGQPLRLAGSTVDITRRKQAEIERRRLEEQLLQARKLEAIGTLAGGIAHDFNNILSAIVGYGELAQKAAPEGTPLRRHLDAIAAAGQRGKSLVERILAFARGGDAGTRVPVHVQSVVDEALDGVAATLPAGVTLRRKLVAGDAGVLGDATQIHQVVMNLCANALQALRGQGRLEVTLDLETIAVPRAVATSTLPAGEYLRLGVADNGAGIAPALLERIFDPFFTTKEVGVGTGLGLSLVHGIVTELGGGIAVDSAVGEGSRFSVYLPVRAHAAAPRAPAALAVERGQGQLVLLVDDEEPLVRLGEEMLAELGYEPVGFTSGADALQALRADPQRVDLLLSDEAMPGLTGSELALAARALRPDLPVVLMSGFVTPALQQRARELGAAAVLGKPLVAADIAAALARARRGLQMPAK
ncbi:MAG: response regulator [Burkholderiaceae bacterium]|nr:response regulator [Burkholderiaceae bacterium]